MSIPNSDELTAVNSFRHSHFDATQEGGEQRRDGWPHRQASQQLTAVNLVLFRNEKEAGQISPDAFGRITRRRGRGQGAAVSLDSLFSMIMVWLVAEQGSRRPKPRMTLMHANGDKMLPAGPIVDPCLPFLNRCQQMAPRVGSPPSRRRTTDVSNAT
jgi:hypothetical protein